MKRRFLTRSIKNRPKICYKRVFVVVVVVVIPFLLIGPVTRLCMGSSSFFLFLFALVVVVGLFLLF